MKRSIVMIEWSRHNEPTHNTRDEFLWHQMLLALLYDEVFVQDENVVSSNRMADWFADGDSFRLLEEIFDCGGLGILKRPLDRYPEELKERAMVQPINTRRAHLEKFSTDNHGFAIEYSDANIAFHNRLEMALASRPSVHRYAGAARKPSANIMKEFARLLTEVLTDRRYNARLSTKFKAVTPRIADDFVQLIENPYRAIDRIKGANPNQTPRFTPQVGELDFNTAIAVQVAASYGGTAANQLVDLIETVFARPFCQEEQAEGRYGGLLRDLPLTCDLEQATDDPGIHVVNVELTTLNLPVPGSNFSKIINTVREKRSGRNLRKAMDELGREPTFASVTRAWRDLADDLASSISSEKVKQVKIGTILAETAKRTVGGVIAGFVLHPPSSHADVISLLGEEGIKSGIKSLVDLGGTLYNKFQVEFERQRLTEQLEKTVEFSCVPHPAIRSA